MSGFRPKQQARNGMYYLEEAILDVLMAAQDYDSNRCIGPAEISKKAGIFRERGEVNIMNDAIVTGFLVKLHSEGKVERCKQDSGKGGWKLTQKEYDDRVDD